MRIAYFTDTYHPEINGVTNTLGYLTAYLRRLGIDYLIFAPDYSDGRADDSEQNVIRFKGLRPHISPASRLVFPNYKTVLQTMADYRPDIIHITSELGIGYCGLRVARELGIPIVMSYHTNFDKYLNFYEFGQLEKCYWKYMTWFHSFAAVNLCPSEDTLHALEKRGLAHLDIWSRGVDLSQFSPANHSEFVRERLGGRNRTLFLYAGRIAKEKGLETFAKAIRIMDSWYGDTVGFVFAGDGPYMQELSEFELPNAVFTGFKNKDDLAQIYASCDVFVFPSGTETFGNVVLEAMASGLPVLCVDAGGVTDFTSHLDNAYLCNQKHIMGLARGMSALLSSPALCDKLRQGGLFTARKRSWNSVFDGLIAQYERACTACTEHPGQIAVDRKFA